MPRDIKEAEEFVLAYFRKQYAEKNKFYEFVGINIEKAFNGHAVQSLAAYPDKHANLYGNAHGGVIMTIGDSCMGVACGSLGKRVVTLDNHTSFISNIDLPDTITCQARVIHNGRHTILMAANVFSSHGHLLGRMRSTYYVIGVFKEIAAVLAGFN